MVFQAALAIEQGLKLDGKAGAKELSKVCSPGPGPGGGGREVEGPH